MTHLSLFSGIGGLDLAAEMAGFKTVGQVEIDDYCNRVLEHHWPGVPRWRDVKDVTAETFEQKTGIKSGALAVLSGGFPCQPVSCAGKRKGDADERWLWDEMLRVICEIRPRWVVAENVRGLLSAQAISDGRKLFGRILRDLAQNGYRVGWLCYGAGDIGAPHRRERVFIVAYSEGTGNRRQQRTGGSGNNVNQEEIGAEIWGIVDNGCSLWEQELDYPKDMAYSDSDEQYRRGGDVQMGRSGRQTGIEQENISQGNEWGIEPRLGDFADGFPSGLAGHRWPAGWWPTPQAGKNTPNATDTEDIVNADGTPWTPGQKPHDRRTGKPVTTALADAVRWPAGPGEQHEWEPPRIATGVRDRVAKLRALGNAVVPAQAYPIFRAIMEIEEAIP